MMSEYEDTMNEKPSSEPIHSDADRVAMRLPRSCADDVKVTIVMCATQCGVIASLKLILWKKNVPLLR